MEIQSVLPSAVDCEKALLSCLLQVPDSTLSLCQERKVTPEWFYNPENGIIYGHIEQMRKEGRDLGFIPVSQYITDKGEMEAIGGSIYLADLFSFAPTASSRAYFIQVLQEKFAARSGILAARNAEDKLKSASNLQEVWDVCTSTFTKTSELCITDEKIDTKKKAIMDFFDEVEEASNPKAVKRFISTPFPTINMKAGGHSPSELVVISGPKGSGKSVAAAQTLCNAVFDHNKGAAVFGLEMPTRQYIRRLTSYMGKISHRNMKFGKMTEGEFKRFGTTLAKIEHAPLEFFDFTNCRMTLDDIERKIRWCHRNIPEFGFAVVDYLQLIRTTSKAEKRRDQELSEVTTRGKQLCNELGINLVVLCAENYDGKIRESGGVEYDCDTRFQIRINKTTEQPEKLWVDKMRDGEAKYSVPVELVGDLCLLREPQKAAVVEAPDF